MRLPAGVRVTSAASVDAHVNGRPMGGSIKGGRTIVVGVPGRRLRSLSLTGAVTGSGGHGRTVKLSLKGSKAARGSLAVRLAG